MPTSAILQALDAAGPGPVRLAEVFGAMGSRVHGMVLLLLALPDTLPMPVPSTSTILGIPLVVVAAHLVLHGEGTALPERADRLKVPHRLVHALVRYAVPVLQALERLSRPRLGLLLRSDRALGLVCLYLAVILLLPIPLMNAAPALCLAAIALGMIQRDGAFVAVGVGATVAVTTLMVFFADRIADLVARLSS